MREGYGYIKIFFLFQANINGKTETLLKANGKKIRETAKVKNFG